MVNKGSRFRSFARKTLASVLIPITLFAGIVNAKSKDTMKKISAEVSYAKDKDIVRFKPFDYTSPDTQRIDLMLGRKFDNFTAYLYFKSDNKDRSWAGVRVDKGLDLGERINANLQFRYFLGLNDESLNHFYFIPTIDYRIDDTFKIGVLGYSKKDEGKDPFFYLGPFVGVKLTERLSTSISYDTDVLGNYGKLIFWNFNYKFGKK